MSTTTEDLTADDKARAARKLKRQSGQFWMRRTTLKDADRSFDTAFWQAQSPEQRFRAAWEIITMTDRLKGYHGTRRLDRSILIKRRTGETDGQE